MSRRVLLLAAFVLVAGCASGEKREAPPSGPTGTMETPGDESTKESEHRVTAEPGYPRVNEAQGGDETAAASRAVTIPRQVTVEPGAAGDLPASVRVAVGFVRAGRLVPRLGLLRSVARACGVAGGVSETVALARLPATTSEPATLADLARAAAAQGAELLLLEVRQDEESTRSDAILLRCGSGRVLACRQLVADDERTVEADTLGTRMAALVRGLRE